MRRCHLNHCGPGAADTGTLTVDVVLQAIGFAANTKGHGLENLGVATDPRTRGIVINDVMETTVPAPCTPSGTSPPS